MYGYTVLPFLGILTILVYRKRVEGKLRMEVHNRCGVQGNDYLLTIC